MTPSIFSATRIGTIALVLSVAIVGGASAPPADDEVVTLPRERGGQDLVGTKAPEFTFDRWVREPAQDGQSNDDGPERPIVTLYRWWTNTCPYCEASLPALEVLRERYAERGLRIVAVYHPKPPRVVDDETILDMADRFGFNGAVATDDDWSILRDFYLSTGRRRATSASFIVDRNGVIRFVHPGPVFFPSEDERHARENDDFELIERAVVTLLEAGEADREERVSQATSP